MGISGINSQSSSAQRDEFYFQDDLGSGTTYDDGAAPRPGEPGSGTTFSDGAAPRPGEPGFGGASPFGSWTNEWVSASRPVQRLTADQLEDLIFS